MPHALTSNLLHCVFSTKDRANLIADMQSLSRYLAGVAREKKIPLIIAGGNPNHVHLLIALPAATRLAKAIQDLKGNSSPWMNQHSSAFAWQEGYGAFRVSASNKQAVMDYIAE
jgi:putative transposase